MNEEQIASQLKQNVQSNEYQHTPAAPTVGDPSQGPVDYGLDELTQYKLHDLFDEEYKPNDEVSRKRLSYIYEQVGEMTGSRDYGEVAAKMREIMRIAGISHSDKKMYRLYQWLRLNRVAKNAHAQMEALSDV